MSHEYSSQENSTRPYDCVISGTCLIDVLCRPVSLDRPIGANVLHLAEALETAAGGPTSNTGITMARLGMNIGVFSFLGRDAWAGMLRDFYRREGIDESLCVELPDQPTSTTLVAIDPSGERSFLHCPGATSQLTGRPFLERRELWKRTRLLLVGYYSLLPNLDVDLAEVFEAVRQDGCQTALDSGGGGGEMSPLDRILPHLDIYVPSLTEARRQTGKDDPKEIVRVYRDCGAAGLLGVKLGAEGVLLSPREGEFLPISTCTPPGKIVDTTGAGDSFYAGLLTGLLRGLSVEEAGRLGAAAAACCVASLGGNAGGRDYEFTARLAGLR